MLPEECGPSSNMKTIHAIDVVQALCFQQSDDNIFLLMTAGIKPYSEAAARAHDDCYQPVPDFGSCDCVQVGLPLGCQLGLSFGHEVVVFPTWRILWECACWPYSHTIFIGSLVPSCPFISAVALDFATVSLGLLMFKALMWMNERRNAQQEMQCRFLQVIGPVVKFGLRNMAATLANAGKHPEPGTDRGASQVPPVLFKRFARLLP